jgi:hypothetical protein
MSEPEKKPMELRLGPSGLKALAMLSVKDFAFIADGKSFPCNKLEAGFLSPRVRDLLLNDFLTSEYDLGSFDLGDLSDAFSQLLSLCRGERLVVDEDNFDAIANLAKGLGNVELNEFLMNFKFGPPDGEKSIQLMIECYWWAKWFDVSTGIYLDYFTTHFYELNPQFVQSLDDIDLDGILSSNSLCIKDEDSLLEIVLGLESRTVNFLRYVRCEYVSVSTWNDF